MFGCEMFATPQRQAVVPLLCLGEAGLWAQMLMDSPKEAARHAAMNLLVRKGMVFESRLIWSLQV
jgi:hypothetical protein